VGRDAIPWNFRPPQRQSDPSGRRGLPEWQDMTTEPGDDDLLRGLRAGDEAAFTAFYRRWQGRLFRFALRMCG
jgi:hypothetical protein